MLKSFPADPVFGRGTLSVVHMRASLLQGVKEGLLVDTGFWAGMSGKIVNNRPFPFCRRRHAQSRFTTWHSHPTWFSLAIMAQQHLYLKKSNPTLSDFAIPTSLTLLSLLPSDPQRPDEMRSTEILLFPSFVNADARFYPSIQIIKFLIRLDRQVGRLFTYQPLITCPLRQSSFANMYRLRRLYYLAFSTSNYHW